MQLRDPASNLRLGARISISMSMSVSAGQCWEAEYENRCRQQEGEGLPVCPDVNDGREVVREGGKTTKSSV